MMECSWIMVWLPTKNRETIFKTQPKHHKSESSRKIQRVFSLEEPTSSKTEGTKLQEPLTNEETITDKTKENTEFNAEKPSSISASKSAVQTFKNKESKLEKQASTVSTRFQVQRQNTEVIANEKEKDESEQKLPDNEEEEEEVFQDVESYTEKLEKILVDLNVNATSLKTKDNCHVLVTFCLENTKVENVLLLLQENGIGNSPSETSISVMPASVHFEVPIEDNSNQSDKEEVVDEGADIVEKRKKSRDVAIDQKIDTFVSTVKSRMLVAEVVKRIRSGVLFTFDYVALVCLASIIAFFGLVENSSVVLVASMLVSPIMGPILGGIFGSVISDKELRNKGIKHEAISLLLIIFIGFVLGLIFSTWLDVYGVTQWPTNEMISRGQLRALGVGALIAIPSGAGVALSVLGDNTGSMVGVAISASLLPPAVNAGLFWALAVVNHDPLFIGYDTINKTEINGTTTETRIVHYERNYSEDDRLEMFLLGLVSLTLTAINIICIILTGWAILRLKEVTPQKIPQKYSSFWTQDVRVHRDYMKTWGKKKVNENLIDEARQVLGIGPKLDHTLENTFMNTLFEKVDEEANYLNITRWEEPKIPRTNSKKVKRQKRQEDSKIEDGDTDDDNSYLRHKRTQSVRQGVLNRRLHNQAKMLIRQSLPPTSLDIQNDAKSPPKPKLSDSSISTGTGMKRSPSVPKNTNNMFPIPRSGSRGEKLPVLEEEKLIDSNLNCSSTSPL